MKTIATHKADQNHAALDPWTIVHFATGLAAGLVGMPRSWSVTAAVAYEVVEQWVERERWGQELFETRRAESIPNALLDIGVFVVGHRLGELWNETDARD